MQNWGGFLERQIFFSYTHLPESYDYTALLVKPGIAEKVLTNKTVSQEDDIIRFQDQYDRANQAIIENT